MFRTGLISGSRGLLASSSVPSSSLRAPLIGGRWYSSQDGESPGSSPSPREPLKQRQSDEHRFSSSSSPAPPSPDLPFTEDLFFAPSKTLPNRSQVEGQPPISPAFSFGNNDSAGPFGGRYIGRSSEDELADQETLWKTRKPLGARPATPSTGRTVKVVDHDVNTAMNLLRGIMGRNGIPAQLRSQARYEKPTEMRNRIKRERRRTHFAAMIRRKVQLVLELKNRGGA